LVIDLSLKDPVERINKIYYNLVFPIKAWGNLDAMAIQCIYTTKFLTLICCVDETAVLLLYKSFFALNKEVLHEPDKLGQSHTVVSKYFQGFHSYKITDKMYLSVLVAYDLTGGLLQNPLAQYGESQSPSEADESFILV